MTVQTSVQQHVAQPDLKEDPLASHSADQSMTPQQQPGSIATVLNAAEGKQDENGAPSPSQVVGAGVLIGAVAIIVGVFGAGFMRTRVERGLGRVVRRFVDSTVEIKVPILLPVAIAETMREMLVGRRVMTPPPGK